MTYPNPNETYSQPPQPQPQMVRVRLPDVKPYAVYALLAVTVLVYVIQLISQNTLGLDLPAELGDKANRYILQGQIWRLITPVFLHGSIAHIGFNMYALFVLGPGIERIWGHTRFLVLYFLAGFAGNVASFVFSPNADSLGASTAIFGLLAAEGIFLYRNQKLFAGRSRSALTQIILVGVINLGYGLIPGTGIDNWGHIGGLIGGLIFSWMSAPLLTVTGFSPDYKLEDHRETREIILGAILVLIIFGAAAAARFVLSLG